MWKATLLTTSRRAVGQSLPANIVAQKLRFTVYHSPVRSTSTTRQRWQLQSSLMSLGRRANHASRIVRPTALWLSPKGVNVDTEQILRQLPCLSHSALRAYNTAIFFVTPKLAHLFEPGSNFLAEAMQRIWSTFLSNLHIRSTQQPASIVAVVDALPAISNQTIRSRSEIYGYEGIAVCVSPRPEYMRGTGEEEAMPLISFPCEHAIRRHGGSLANITYAAPVANTLFVNGRKHTMFQMKWEFKDGKILPATDPEYLCHLKVPVYDSKLSTNAHVAPLPAVLNIKLLPITKPATIVTSMGNIIRQIKSREGPSPRKNPTIPASQELEKIFPPMVKAMQAENPGVELRVFAIVTPPSSKAGELVEELFKTPAQDHNDLRGSVLHLMLARGARLYRVTSGGAGWGKSAGLLSLEPAVQLNSQPSESTTSFPFLDFGDDEISVPTTKDLFPPDHIVQFVASCHDPQGQKKDGLSIQDMQKDVEWLHRHYMQPNKIQKFCVGTTVLPETIVERAPTEVTSPENDALTFCPNVFGFLSASAMQVAISEAKAREESDSSNSTWLGQEVGNRGESFLHSTLIEVPNSAFITISQAGGGTPLQELADRGALTRKVTHSTPKNFLMADRKPRIKQSDEEVASPPITKVLTMTRDEVHALRERQRAGIEPPTPTLRGEHPKRQISHRQLGRKVDKSARNLELLRIPVLRLQKMSLRARRHHEIHVLTSPTRVPIVKSPVLSRRRLQTRKIGVRRTIVRKGLIQRTPSRRMIKQPVISVRGVVPQLRIRRGVGTIHAQRASPTSPRTVLRVVLTKAVQKYQLRTHKRRREAARAWRKYLAFAMKIRKYPSAYSDLPDEEILARRVRASHIRPRLMADDDKRMRKIAPNLKSLKEVQWLPYREYLAVQHQKLGPVREARHAPRRIVLEGSSVFNPTNRETLEQQNKAIESLTGDLMTDFIENYSLPAGTAKSSTTSK